MNANRTTITVLSVALLCGCGDRAQKQKIANLEKRLITVESKASETETNVSDLFHVIVTNQLSYVSLNLKQLDVNTTNDERLDNLEDLCRHLVALDNAVVARLSNIEDALPRQPGRPALARVVQPAASRNGVPTDVYKSISDAAVKRWPTDYEMQVYDIQKQVDAYENLHP